MKIAITAEGPSLDSKLDPRFGRCVYFLIVDPDDFSFEAFENPNIGLGGGAGIQSAQMVADKGVKAIITGNCGPNALKVLSAANVSIIDGCYGTVRAVIQDYKEGRISPGGDSSPQGGGQFRPGAGSGGGRGLGGGRGGGMGGGQGRR